MGEIKGFVLSILILEIRSKVLDMAILSGCAGSEITWASGSLHGSVVMVLLVSAESANASLALSSEKDG